MIQIDVIEEREEQIIGTDKDGNLTILPNSLYYKIKREMDGRILLYDGRRTPNPGKFCSSLHHHLMTASST